MANFKFKIGKSDDLLKSINETLSVMEWDRIEKARPVQYIKKIPNPNYKGKGDNKFKYFYKEDLFRPLKSLMDFFGIGEKRINEDYEKNNIEKDYGVNKETWASHVLEFFVNKEKWTRIFADKKKRDTYKKPVKQEKVERAAGQPVTDPKNKKTKSSVINRSLMRKVWSIYSAEGKQATQNEKDEKVVDKKIINNNKPEKKKPIEVTPEEYKTVMGFMPVAEFQTVLNNSKKGEEKEHFKKIVKDTFNTIKKVVENAVDESSYNEETELHDKGFLHYFAGGNDWYISEVAEDGIAYGYAVLNGDTQNSEFGYINLKDVLKVRGVELDLYTDQSKSMEHAICRNYPELKDDLLKTAEEYNAEPEESEAEKHANRSAAMMGNDNAKKEFSEEVENIENDSSINGVGENTYDNNIESGRISERDSSLRTERGGSGTDNGLEDGRGSGERSDIEFNSLQSGKRSGSGETESNGSGDLNRRLTGKEILKIREQCEKLLAEKKDDEFTEADKALLRLYSGAGGTNKKDATAAEVLNEYYTPYDVINKVWELVDKYNPRQDKTVIEPSAGIGRFAEGRSEKFTMFELSETTGRINKILHPDANVHIGTFQRNFMDNGMFTKDFEKFDVAVGNPPYGRYSGKEKGKGEGKIHSRYEEYFIDRTLDTLKDGGILAMVVPSSVLRSPDSKAKKILESKGELLEAWRLPNGTFDTTDVGTDIIIMRKGKGKAGSLSNDQYFKDNPQCIIGAETERNGRWGMEKYVSLDGRTVTEALNEIKVDKIAIDQKEVKTASTAIAETVSDEEKAKIATKKINDDFVGRKTSVNKKTGETTYTWKDGRTIKQNKNGKVTFDSAQGGELKPKKSEAEKKRNRSEAMKGNDNAAGEHNYPPSAGKIMSAAEFAAKYTSREIDPKEMEIWKYTDYTGLIDKTKLSDELLEYVEKSNRYVTTNGKLENVITFASGNIVEKLENLDKDDPEYDKKKSILEQAKPKTKEVGEFTLSPIDNWTWDYNTSPEGEVETVNFRGHKINKNGLIAQFFLWAKDPEDRWATRGKSPISKYEIPDDISWGDVCDYILGDELAREPRRYGVEDGDKAYRKMKRKNLRRQTAEKLFARFLQEGLDPDSQKKLRDDWNRKFNSNVNPDYSQMPVYVDGMSTHKGSKEFNLLNQQIKGVSFLASKGSGLLAYDVGVGKTATGIVATINQLQTGKAKRPLICVPAAVYKKWVKEIKQHFPNQEIVELGNLRGSKEENYEQFKDGALHVCTYEALDVIGFTEETENELYEDVEFATDNPFAKDNKRQAAQKKEDTDFTVGQMTKTSGKLKYEFEKMGIDHITVDEIHNFNHVFASPRVYGEEQGATDNGKGGANEFSGMGGSVSAAGQKMFAITQYIQRHNDNRNVFGLSATPFTNKPAEVYSILSLIARKRMKELGIANLQEFMQKFADVSLEYVVKGNGTVDQQNIMKSFTNLNTLQSFIQEYIDKVDGEAAGVIRPHKKTYTPMLEKNEIQEAILNYEIDRMTNAGPEDPGAALVAMNNMRQAILSPSFVNPSLYGEYAKAMGKSVEEVQEMLSGEKCVENSPKLKFVCDSIIEQYKQNNKNGQFMYVPRGVEYHKYIKKYLVDHGIPEDAVEILGQETGSGDKKLEAKKKKVDDFNNPDGKLKVLIGNESTKEGVSLNGNATTCYNCMLGWNPTEATQVEGRVWRQGNKQGVTSIVYPLLYDSLDARLYQLYEEKKGRIDSIFSYKGDSLNVEDIKADDMKYALIRDPEVKANMAINKELEELKAEIRSNDSTRDILHDSANVFNDVKESADYRSILDRKNSTENELKQHEEILETYKKYEKKLTSKDDDVREMAEYKIGKELDRFTRWNDRTLPAAEKYANAIKVLKEDYIADEKKRVSKFEKSLKTLEFQNQKQRETLAKQGIMSADDLQNKINRLTERKAEVQKEIDGLKDKRTGLVEQYKRELLEAQIEMPSVEDQVKDYTRSIMDSLRPMDEVKAWVREMRSQGMSNQAIKDEVERRVSKSFCYFKKNGSGDVRFYIAKSLVNELLQEIEQ